MAEGRNPNISRGQFYAYDQELRGESGELETYRGVTVNLRTGERLSAKEGYVVADPGGQSRPRGEHRPSHLPQFARERKSELLNPGGSSYYGVFVDSRTVDRDVSRYYRTAPEAFKAMRKRGRTSAGEMSPDPSTEQKSGYVIHNDDLIYNPHHPDNYDRILKGLRESSYS